jgi:hypothetical protein
MVVANVMTVWLFVGSWMYGSQTADTKLTTYTEGCITQEQDELGGEHLSRVPNLD